MEIVIESLVTTSQNCTDKEEMEMKNIVRSFLFIFLVLGLTFTAQAGPASLKEGCIDASVSVSPDCVQAGESITVSGFIRNCSRRQAVEATLGMLGLVEIEDLLGIEGHFKPKLITPPGRKNTRAFSYRAKVLDTAGPGVYHIALRVKGKRSGYAEDYARLTVGECGVIPY